jgi:hypothetical protein
MIIEQKERQQICTANCKNVNDYEVTDNNSTISNSNKLCIAHDDISKEKENQICKIKANSDLLIDLQSLLDIKESCQSAIDILNDLLLYDKLEDGEMTLERRPVNVKLTLERMLKPFTVQVNIYMSTICWIICYGYYLLSW